MFWLVLIKFRGQWSIDCSSWDKEEIDMAAKAAKRNKYSFARVSIGEDTEDEKNRVIELYNKYF